MRTYIFDIDGTIVKNLTENDLELAMLDDTYIQELLPGVAHFFISLQETDKVIFITARLTKYREMTERMLKYNNLEYSHLIMDLPMGVRYLINDTLNPFYKKAIGINIIRDSGFGDSFIFDPEF